MKIDIITLHYINHYGSLLQTYATCKMFAKMGHNAEIIDYIRPNAEEKIQLRMALNAKGFKKLSLKGIAFVLSKKIENKKRKEFSNAFLSKYVPMTRRYMDYEDLKKNPPIADIYVTGSDQTWNSEYNGGVLPAYYLDFVPGDKKRIGYSVSIGMPKIPEKEYNQTKKYIEKYAAISVRENSAKEIIQNMGYNNVMQILDPTLILNREDWLPLVANRMVDEPYIVIYKLNSIPEIESFAENLAQKTGFKIVRMSYYLNHYKYKGKMIYSPTVEEFLSLIYHAEYVLTDSFHCLAFSLNFGKEFYAFYPNKYSTRLKSLMELTGTTDRVVENPEKFVNTKIDYSYVNDILERERKKAIKFIADNCETSLNK